MLVGNRHCPGGAPARASLVLTLLLLAGTVPARADFVDVTPAVLAETGEGVGVSWGDFDFDGDPDIYLSNFGGIGKLFRNDGADAFADVTPAAAAIGDIGGSAWGDYDRDGDLDLFIARFFFTGVSQNVLLRNDGDLVFTDVTTPLVADTGNSRGMGWVDYDLDGDLDVFVAGFGDGGFLLRNDDGVFHDATPPELAQPETFNAAIGDYDGDRDPDFYLVRQDFANRLVRNDGALGFTDVTGTGPLADAGTGRAADWGDVDNDGDLDLFLANRFQNNRLYRNDGGDTFVDLPLGSLVGGGPSFGAMWGDVDNDGDLDLYVTDEGFETNQLLLNAGGGSFVDGTVGPLTGNGDGGGCAWADYDGDGDLDLYVANLLEPNQLLRNDGATGNHWLQVELQGVANNVFGVGARIEVTAGGVTQVRELSGTNGISSQNGTPASFGLGASMVASDVTVRWPTGEVQSLTSVRADQRIAIASPSFGDVTRDYEPESRLDLAVDVSSSTQSALGMLRLRSRRAGSSEAFATTPMGFQGAQATAVLGPDATTRDGLEYFFEYTLRLGQVVRRFPPRGTERPAFVPAVVTEAMPASAPETYQLFGFPFEPETAAPATLESSLGPPDESEWRFGRWDPAIQAYRSYPDPSLRLAPGNGFWLITRHGVAPTATGHSTNTVDGVELVLEPGWNQLAHPYFFSVALADVDLSRAPSVETRAVAFEGGRYVDVDELQPWQGFWMRHGGSVPETIVIPGRAAVSRRPASDPRDHLSWWIEASATQGGMRDLENLAGVLDHPGSESGDASEPPGLPGLVRVHFDRNDRGTRRELTRDVRSEWADGQTWILVVEAPAGSPVLLELSTGRQVPTGFTAELASADGLTRMELEGPREISLRADTVHRFQLIVGSRRYVAAERSASATEVALGNLYPNPCVDGVAIPFALPRESRTTLDVYDVGGRLVRTLIAERLPRNVYTIRWDGRDRLGRETAAGVYFVQLRAGDVHDTRKILRVR